MLPEGKAVLFTVLRHWDWGTAQIVVQSLDTGKREVLIEPGVDARYVPTGHLIFAREGTLMAVPFDLANLEVTGAAAPVLEGVSQVIHAPNSGSDSGAAQFAFSADSGTLAYIAGTVFPEFKMKVVWVDRNGKPEPTGIDPEQYLAVRLHPDDDNKVLLNTFYKDRHIWTYDLARGIRQQQTLEAINQFPIWSPDGASFAFQSNRTGPRNLFWKPVDGGGDAEQLWPSKYTQDPASWSSNGELAYVQTDSENLCDIWILKMDGSRSARPFLETGLETKFREQHPAFSHDGRWLAYASDLSGQWEVYVRPYPGPGSRQQISLNGGRSPAWSGDSRELFYRSGPHLQKMMAVEIRYQGDELAPGDTVELFRGRYLFASPVRSYDVTPDGQRFLMVQRLEDDDVRQISEQYLGNRINLVSNWFEELTRLVPTD